MSSGSPAERPSTEVDAATPAAPARPGRIERWAAHPLGPVALFAAAVAEACLFPAPTEAMFGALALLRPERTVRFGLVALAGSVVGALLGYMIGAALASGSLTPPGGSAAYAGYAATVRTLYRENLALALITSGYTPIPFLAYTISAGAIAIPLVPFLAFATLGRALKLVVLGALTRYLGPPLRAWASRRSPYVWGVAAVLLAAAAAWLLR